ncbi:hypothetical protein PR048_003031 [Dryococelus australis]|uniref:Uncharacterized protein n=1 Tax=Dryococelus australis TaxID=614101 RepID=A0ABQ9IMX8_9NEOP|nr:hypothetical protein PR048_003031 [Dryococelus australis]
MCSADHIETDVHHESYLVLMHFRMARRCDPYPRTDHKWAISLSLQCHTTFNGRGLASLPRVLSLDADNTEPRPILHGSHHLGGRSTFYLQSIMSTRLLGPYLLPDTQYQMRVCGVREKILHWQSKELCVANMPGTTSLQQSSCLGTGSHLSAVVDRLRRAVSWPPRSLDHNPVNFFLWGFLKKLKDLVYHDPVDSI